MNHALASPDALPHDRGPSAKHRRIRPLRRSLVSDTAGLTTSEYVILLAMIAVVGYAAWRKFGRTVEGSARAAEILTARIPNAGGRSSGR